MNELNEQQWAELHQALLTLRTELQQLLEDSSDGAQPISLDEPIGRLSRMDAMQQQAMAQATARRTEIELQRIRTALGRLQSGDYGYCVKCEEEIAEGRLRADPSTLVCIDCAKASEGK